MSNHVTFLKATKLNRLQKVSSSALEPTISTQILRQTDTAGF